MWLLFAFLISIALLPVGAQPPTSAQADFFEKQIRPIFASRCQSCHGVKVQSAGLNLTSAAGFRAFSARLLPAIGGGGRVRMPPTGKLSDGEIAALREWVNMGAPWPESDLAGTPARDHWSFLPTKRPPLPAVRNEGWVRNPIDRFILTRLEARGMSPAPPADKLTLIRRITYDLTGLPPAEEEVRAFVGDTSADAFGKAVDRLLASPRYGERWGRHWLDVARYADSTGADEDHRYPHAWRYRDYVIDAFNRDLPYDRFIREQIAGDLLPDEKGGEVNTAGIIATGFLALGPKLIAEQDKPKMFYDIVDEQIDVTGKAVLGLTIACARCHDHKFDPISTKDYYSLASIFASTKQLSKLEGTVSKLYFAPLVGREAAERYEAYQQKLEKKKHEIDEVRAAEARRYRDAMSPRVAEYMLAARKVYAESGAAVDIAKSASLDSALLARWVEYLKPGKEHRPHLEPWYHSSSSELESVARRYQTDFQAVAAKRDKTFQPGDNRFFTEVAAAKGPLGIDDKSRDKSLTAALDAEMENLKNNSPHEPPFACGVGEGKNVDQRVFVRGNPELLGDPVSKRFPSVLAGESQPSITSGSGRLELANWLADPRNPLPARVMANRIWQGHFGEGLVRTPSNFGLAGERPSHPELLDWLASEFVARGWSIKALHRLIVLSNAYQMSGAVTPEKREIDSDNRLLSRFKMRRLAVEEIRDSLLAADGSLNLTMGGALQTGEGTDKEFSDDRKSPNPDSSSRRTVYLPLRRSNLASLFTLYDFGDATTSTEARAQTNVAPQALFMMNSAFVESRARSLALKVMDDRRGVERAWYLVLGREPDASERTAARDYLERFPAKAGAGEGHLLAWSSLCRSLMASNDFIYVH